jgi:sugar phosphate isomerase/epimerase
MTTTAARTAEILQAINHPNVGALYDQANIAFFPAEEYEEAIELQKGRIYYVHCKDLVYRGGVPTKPKFTRVSSVDESERTVHSRIPGEGILNWPAILKKLKQVGYDGWISLEYERRWQKIDLPDASVGMARGAEYIRNILKQL